MILQMSSFTMEIPHGTFPKSNPDALQGRSRNVADPTFFVFQAKCLVFYGLVLLLLALALVIVVCGFSVTRAIV